MCSQAEARSEHGLLIRDVADSLAGFINGRPTARIGRSTPGMGASGRKEAGDRSLVLLSA